MSAGLRIVIPGRGELDLRHLVLDYNGTLALDGALLPGVAEALTALAPRLRLTVLTADIHGDARQRLQGLPCDVRRVPAEAQDIAKRDFVRRLGAVHCVAVGNGRNDIYMLGEAALGIAVLQQEGAFAGALAAADVVVPDIGAALGLLRHPKRLIATLRN